MKKTTAVAGKRANHIRRYSALGFAAALYVLWFCGICGVLLPIRFDPYITQPVYVVAQLLLCLPIFTAVMPGQRRREERVLPLSRASAVWLFAFIVSAVADSAFVVSRVLHAIGQSNLQGAWRVAIELPLAPVCFILILTNEVSRRGDCLPVDLDFSFVRCFLLCIAAVTGCAFSVNLFFGAGVAASLHAALLLFTVGTPSSLFLAFPLLSRAANKRTSLCLSFADWARIGKATVLCADINTLWREEYAALDDIYVSNGSKTALLAIAAALAREANTSCADLLGSAADTLRLRLPQVVGARRTANGFCGTAHRRAWHFSTDSAGAPALIRHTDLGGRQALFAFCNDSFRGILLFAHSMHADASAATEFLRNCGIRVTAWQQIHAISLPFSHTDNEKVLHASREGATIKLSDAYGAISVCGGTPRELAHAVQSGQCVTATARTAVGISATVALFSVPIAIDSLAALRAPFLLAVAIMRLAALVVVDRLAWCVQHAHPPEFQIEEERTAIFGKVNYTLRVEGMSCSHCAAHVKTALESIRGVSADVVLEEKVAHVKCPASLDTQKLSAAVTDAGFTVASVERV